VIGVKERSLLCGVFLSLPHMSVREGFSSLLYHFVRSDRVERKFCDFEDGVFTAPSHICDGGGFFLPLSLHQK